MIAPSHVRSSFVEVGPVDQLSAGAPIVVAVGDTTIALFRLGDRVLAIEDSCVRCGHSLAEGRVEGTHVTCTGCTWDYDIPTGMVHGLAALYANTFEVRIVDARIMIAGRLVPNVPGRPEPTNR